jgi:LysM domain
MSALSAIETPVAGEPGSPSAATMDAGHAKGSLQAVGSRRSSAALPRRDGVAGRQPSSSSIPEAPARQPERPRSARVSAPGASVPVITGRVVPATDPRVARAAEAVRVAAGLAARHQQRSAAGAAVAGPAAVVAPAGLAAPRPRLRLTRRGRIVVGALVMAAATAAALLIMLLGPGGAQATDHGPARAGYQGLHQVVVQPGQTLWSIAAAAEPAADTRVVIQEIMAANALDGSGISAGQLLWVP